MDYNDMTDAQQDAFWQAAYWEDAETAADDVYLWRREAAKKVMARLQDRYDQLGFGHPAIAVYADELARLARLPYPTHGCQLPDTSADVGAAA